MRILRPKSLIALFITALMVLPLAMGLLAMRADASENPPVPPTPYIENGGSAGGGDLPVHETPSPTSGGGSGGGGTSTPAPTSGGGSGGGTSTPAPNDDDEQGNCTLYTEVSGGGGTISPKSSGGYYYGQVVPISATPKTGYRLSYFEVYYDDATRPSSLPASGTVTMRTRVHVIAYFVKITYYTITATAGTGGSISPSGAQSVAKGSSLTFAITPSAGYAVDTVTYNGVSKGAITSFNTGAVTENGTVSATFKKVTTPTTDLSVTSITPLYARVGLNMLSLVTFHNASGSAITTTLNFGAGSATQTKTVTVPANASGNATFTWVPAGLGSVTVSANINPDKTITEPDYTNNMRAETVIVREIVDPADPDPKTPVPVVSPPNGENNDYVEWTGPDGTLYWARLTLTATADKTAMKSGYGFRLTVTPTLTTNCPDSSVIIQPQAVVMRVPESHYETGVMLIRTSSTDPTIPDIPEIGGPEIGAPIIIGDPNSMSTNGRGGVYEEATTAEFWTLPVNPASVLGSSVWFVPVWFPDVDYVGIVTVYGAFTPGGELTASVPVRIAINGSMYEDDSTNNGWGG